MLGETVICRHSHFFCKLPGDGKRVSWHQDASYWPLSPSRVVSIWLAIDDATEANGAMQVIPRSHTDAQVPFFDSDASENNVLGQTVRDPASHGDAPVSLVIEGGTDFAAQRLALALLGAEPLRRATLWTGIALPQCRRARLQRLERPFGHLPRPRSKRALGQPSKARGRDHSGSTLN